MFQTNNRLPLNKVEDTLSYVASVSRVEQREIERCFARLFATEDGKRVLAYLQLITFHRAASGNTSDTQLRHMDGQRSLMASILRLIDRGRNG